MNDSRIHPQGREAPKAACSSEHISFDRIHADYQYIFKSNIFDPACPFGTRGIENVTFENSWVQYKISKTLFSANISKNDDLRNIHAFYQKVLLWIVIN